MYTISFLLISYDNAGNRGHLRQRAFADASALVAPLGVPALPAASIKLSTSAFVWFPTFVKWCFKYASRSKGKMWGAARRSSHKKHLEHSGFRV
jgi:hypothetical protein